MKTFIVVLAAGAIIFAAFVGWQRLDRWEQAKVYWTAQFRQARDNMLREMPRDIMVNLSVDALTEAINRLDHATSVRTRAAHELRLYLENKPFRLPLFDEENRLLAESRKITGGTYAENRKVRIQSGLTPTPTPDTPTPAPTDTPTPAPTDTPTPTPTPTDSKVATLPAQVHTATENDSSVRQMIC